MPRAEVILDVAIVTRPLVLVLDHQADRRAGGLAFENARKNLNFVRLLALCGEARLAGLAPVQIELNVGFGNRDSWRCSINHTTNRRTVAFPPAGEPKGIAKTVAGHLGLRIARPECDRFNRSRKATTSES